MSGILYTLRPAYGAGGARAARMLAAALSVFAAAMYFVTAVGVLHVRGLPADDPAGAVLLGVVYVLVTVLVVNGRRFALAAALLINTIDLVAFYVNYASNVDVIVSVTGLATKAAQAPLELLLIYLLAAALALRRRSRPA